MGGGSFSPGWFELVAQPTFTGSYSERQNQWIEHHGLKVGDNVKVVRVYKNGDNGFCHSSADMGFSPKCKCLGKESKVVLIENCRIVIAAYNKCDYTFPYFALEPVK